MLSGVPADVTVECDAVPAPASPTATDTCDPVPALTFAEVRIDGDCPNRYGLRRTWTATDRCGNARSTTQSITVVDTTPPVVTSGSDTLYCLWPPNHKYVCFDAASFAPHVTDNCGGTLTWQFVDCHSSQPDNDVADGNTVNDCTVAGDGQSFCVRSEWQGTKREGRFYDVTVVATDACGNNSNPTVIGRIHVPHDQRDERERDCMSPNP
jgi:hypothetical protein